MSKRQVNIVVHNHGVIAGEINGGVRIGGEPSVGPRRSSADSKARAPMSVSELLGSLFDADSLRRFLDASPGCRQVIAELPLPPASTAMIMYEAEQILRRYGLLNSDLAEGLTRRFPGRGEDIRRCLEMHIGASAP